MQLHVNLPKWVSTKYRSPTHIDIPLEVNSICMHAQAELFIKTNLPMHKLRHIQRIGDLCVKFPTRRIQQYRDTFVLVYICLPLFEIKLPKNTDGENGPDNVTSTGRYRRARRIRRGWLLGPAKNLVGSVT